MIDGGKLPEGDDTKPLDSVSEELFSPMQETVEI
jgi:hypothetical protein